MPTITFSLKDLNSLIGKKLSPDELAELAHNAKGDFEGYDKDTSEIKIDFGDTNLPYLWSVEGFTRFIKGILGIEKALPEIKINASDFVINVDKSVNTIRPFISAFVAKGVSLDDYTIKQLIQQQEKLSENYGRKREMIAIGLYPLRKIKFPITYKAVVPEGIKFIPLEFKVPLTLREILEMHPKGKQYSKLLAGKKQYPILIDSKNDVLSFPPIINSELTGKLAIGDSELFFEATGTDLNAVLLVTNIFAQALFERGFRLFLVGVKYSNRVIKTPLIKHECIKVEKEKIRELLGLELNPARLKKLLESMRYDYSQGKVLIPHYRADIMHQADVIEDIGIAYGYDNLAESPLKSYTIGTTSRLVDFIDNLRELVIGLGYNEVMSPVLGNKATLYDKMNIEDFGTVEIEDYMSETYSVVRTWLLPILIDCLSKNKHVEQPHRIFEQGIVAVRKSQEIIEYERIALVSSHEKANFTEMKQILDYLTRLLNFKYKIQETEHGSFIPGRVGRVIVNGKKVGFIGEIHPQVLENFGIEAPVVAMELNLGEIFEETNPID